MANSVMAIATSAVSPAAEPAQEETGGDASDFASLFHSTMSSAGAVEAAPEGNSDEALPTADQVVGAPVPADQCPLTLDASLVSLLSGLPVITEPLVRLPEVTLNEGMAVQPQSSSVVSLISETISVSESTGISDVGQALPEGPLGSVAPEIMAGMGGQGVSLSQTSLSGGARNSSKSLLPEIPGETVSESRPGDTKVSLPGDVVRNGKTTSVSAQVLGDEVKNLRPSLNPASVPISGVADGAGNKAIQDNPVSLSPELMNMKPVLARTVSAGAVSDKISSAPMSHSSGLNGMIRNETVVAQGQASLSDSGNQGESGDGTAEEFAGELTGPAPEKVVSESAGNGLKGQGVRQELPFGETVASLLGQVKTTPGLATGAPLHRFEKIQQLLDNVGIHVLEVVKGGGNQMTISLVPGELGRVLLSCQEKGHTVSVAVQAENQMACSLLQRQEDTVRTLLAEGGYELGRFEVGGWSGQQQEAPGKQQSGQMFDEDEAFFGEDLKRGNVGLSGAAKPVGSSSTGSGRFWAVA